MPAEQDDTQARRDLEVATARAADLADRLVTASAELAETRRQLEQLREEYESLRAAHENMQRSPAFRLASKLWGIGNAVGRRTSG